MKSQNPALLSAKFIAKDVVGDLLYWPVWWYSRGLVDFLKQRRDSIKDFEAEIGLTVWIVNWGKPMYGQYDIAGKIISFIIRTFGILFKSLLLVLYLIGQAILAIGWVVLPPILVWQLLKSLI